LKDLRRLVVPEITAVSNPNKNAPKAATNAAEQIMVQFHDLGDQEIMTDFAGY
jgi:hypothetical protein